MKRVDSEEMDYSPEGICEHRRAGAMAMATKEEAIDYLIRRTYLDRMLIKTLNGVAVGD